MAVFVSNAYGEDGRRLSGSAPDCLVPLLEGLGADAVGVFAYGKSIERFAV